MILLNQFKLPARRNLEHHNGHFCDFPFYYKFAVGFHKYKHIYPPRKAICDLKYYSTLIKLPTTIKCIKTFLSKIYVAHKGKVEEKYSNCLCQFLYNVQLRLNRPPAVLEIKEPLIISVLNILLALHKHSSNYDLRPRTPGIKANTGRYERIHLVSISP